MKFRIAEWILSLVLSPEHAASAIGDWKEESRPLWLYVLRTMVSQIQSDFIENPGFMIWLGIRGYLFSLLLLGAGMILLIIAIPVFFMLAAPFHWKLPPSAPSGSVLGWTLVGYSMFISGRWVARRAPGKEMAGFIAAWLVPQTVFTFAGVIVMHFWGSQIEHFLLSHQPTQGDSSYSSNLGGEAMLYICLFAGAMRQRRRFLRSVAS